MSDDHNTISESNNETKDDEDSEEELSDLNPITIEKLKKYEGILHAIHSAPSVECQNEILQNMSNSSFDMLCDCMQHFLRNEEIVSNYFETEEQGQKLKEILAPWASSLNSFTDPQISRIKKKRLVKKSQKGGSAILAAIIGSLVPMAVNAVWNWIHPKSS